MVLLAACGILTVIAAGLLTWPLWRGLVKPLASPQTYDLTVYKAQLDDLERDLMRGVVDPQEGQLLRLEIERRILKVKTQDETSGPSHKETGRRWGLIAAVLLTVLLVPGGIYGLLGSPHMEDQPIAARSGKIEQMQAQMSKVTAMVEQLSAKLQDNPNDGSGWAMLGRSLRVLGQPERARSAYSHALSLLPNDVQVRLEYGSLLIEDLPAEATLPDEFVSVMRDVLAINPDVPDALYFVGLAEAQAGNTDKARALWTILLKKIPQSSADRVELEKQIKSLR